jgi:adenylate cyclase, class 2
MRRSIAPAQSVERLRGLFSQCDEGFSMRPALTHVLTRTVSIETEIKIRMDDPEGFCRGLDPLHPGILSARHFEDNYLFDFPNQRLGFRQCLLRVRLAAGECLLTYKGPSRQEGIFKTREEFETKIEDASTLLQILDGIGLQICFRYQKYRREFALDGVHVAVDETPIGNYVEIEGSEDGIKEFAHKMEIAESQFLRDSYHGLYLEHCQKNGVVPHFMIF